MANNTVILKNYASVREEYVAAAAITPGMLIEYTSAGKVQAHSTAGGNALKMIAVEDEFQGKEIGDAYAANDLVQCWIAQRGDQAQMLLKNGEDITKGDLLESAGNGYVQKHTSDEGSAPILPGQIIGEALESLDLSGSSGADPSNLIAVRIY